MGGNTARRRSVVAAALLSAALVAHAFVPRAHAVNGECGQPISNGAKPTPTDALFVLKAGLGLETCAPCVCDLNGNGTISSTDALIDLGVAVGQPLELLCPACECPPVDGLDDVVFNEIYTCVQSFSGQPEFCADQNVGDAIRFTHIGDGNYEIRNEPADEFVYTGTLDCTVFDWLAESPGEYTEGGTWTFSSDLTSFSGSSTYVADDVSYEGRCNETGAAAPDTPPNPPTIAPCP